MTIREKIIELLSSPVLSKTDDKKLSAIIILGEEKIDALDIYLFIAGEQDKLCEILDSATNESPNLCRCVCHAASNYLDIVSSVRLETESDDGD